MPSNNWPFSGLRLEFTSQERPRSNKDSVTLNIKSRKIGLGDTFQGTVNMPNPETASLVIQCRRLMVVSKRENPQPEPSQLGAEGEPSNLALDRLGQRLGNLR